MSNSFHIKISEHKINSISNDSIKNKKTIFSKEKTKKNKKNEQNFEDKEANNLTDLTKSNKNFESFSTMIPEASQKKCSEKYNNFFKEQKIKQCRKNLNNRLKQNLDKNQWSSEEDCLLFIFYQKFDSSWKKLSYLFNGRSESMIKNHFYSLLKQKAIKNNEKPQNSKLKLPLNELLKYLDDISSEVKNEFCKLRKMNEIQFNNFIKTTEKNLNLILSQKVKFKNINKNKKKVDFLHKKTKRNNINDVEIDSSIKNEEKDDKFKININKFNKSLDIINTDSFHLFIKSEKDLKQNPLIKLYSNNLFNFNTIINLYNIFENNNFYINFGNNIPSFNSNNIINNNCCDHNNKIIMPQNVCNSYSQYNSEDRNTYKDLYIIDELLREVRTQYFKVINIIKGLDRLLIILNLLENNNC